MRYKTDRNGFDDLSIPIIICDLKGFVQYKNDAAVKQVRLPKRKTDIHTHLTQIGKNAIDSITDNTDPVVIDVFTGDRNARAFVVNYEWKGEKASLWIFLCYLQAYASSYVLSSLENNLALHARDICDIIIAVDKKSREVPGRNTNILTQKISKRLEHMISIVLRDQRRDYSFPAPECFKILSDNVSGVFREFGYNVDMSISDKLFYSRKRLNYRDFLLFYTHILTLACELTRNRKVKVEVSENYYGDALFVVSFTVLFPPFYVSSERDVSKLGSLAHGHDVDLVLIQKLIDICGYNMEFSVADRYSNNVVFKFILPYTTHAGLCSPRNNDYENRRLIEDTHAFIAFMLSCATFVPDNTPIED